MITVKQIKAKLSYTPGKTWKNKKTYQTKSSKELYYKYLEDARWKNRRNEILVRDGYTCQICGGMHKLNVHHKYYKTYDDGSICPPWYYNDSALITLCEDCHKKVHDSIGVAYYVVPRSQQACRPAVSSTKVPQSSGVAYYGNASSKEMAVPQMREAAYNQAQRKSKRKAKRKWAKYLCLIPVVVGVLMLC